MLACPCGAYVGSILLTGSHQRMSHNPVCKGEPRVVPPEEVAQAKADAEATKQAALDAARQRAREQQAALASAGGGGAGAGGQPAGRGTGTGGNTVGPIIHRENDIVLTAEVLTLFEAAQGAPWHMDCSLSQFVNECIVVACRAAFGMRVTITREQPLLAIRADAA